MLETITPQPQDAILSLMAAFREDPREAKIDLGVGVYRDAGGNTPVMRAVKAAERRIWEAQDTKVYTGLAGDPAFGAAMRALVLGEAVDASRTAVIATPGGTGAVHKGVELARMASEGLTVHLPDPTWPNHPAILRHLGVPTRTYRYFDAATRAVDVDGMVADLGAAKPGDLVVLHGCCHNPTGADPSPEDWERVARAIEAAGATVLIDLAYQGFGEGLDADAHAARLLASRLPECLIAASCSKNFGIYRERTGALIAVTENAELAQGAMASLNRLNYSFPPDHGARIVQTILGDEALVADWREELSGIRDHMMSLRGALASELRQRTNSDRFDFLARHRGMFSRLGATPEQVERMRAEHGVYMVGDGRINVAGLNAATVPALAHAIVEAGSRARPSRDAPRPPSRGPRRARSPPPPPTLRRRRLAPPRLAAGPLHEPAPAGHGGAPRTKKGPGRRRPGPSIQDRLGGVRSWRTRGRPPCRARSCRAPRPRAPRSPGCPPRRAGRATRPATRRTRRPRRWRSG